MAKRNQNANGALILERALQELLAMNRLTVARLVIVETQLATICRELNLPMPDLSKAEAAMMSFQLEQRITDKIRSAPQTSGKKQ